MKSTRLLFPHKFQPVGYVIWFLGLCLLSLNVFFDLNFTIQDLRTLLGNNVFSGVESGSVMSVTPETGLLFTISVIMLVLGSLFAGFSKFKIEDDYFKTIRFESMLMSFYLYVLYLLLVLLFTWHLRFLVFAVYGCFATMVFYIILLSIRIILARKGVVDEK